MYLWGPKPTGDHAMDAFDMEFDRVSKAPVNVFVDHFECEAKKRGIVL